MVCPKCGKEMSVQLTTNTKLKRKRSCLYWLIIGWWLNPIMWLFFTIPMLIIKIFRPKKQKLKQKIVKNYVCQSCGYNCKF